jgi:CRP-like cAMP-binding protein
MGKTVIMVTHDPSLARRTDRSLLLSDGELIHEQVARSFPELPHPRLLWLTHKLQTRNYKPGEIIASQDSQDFGLMLVTSGDLRVNFTQNGHPQPPAPGRLATGEFISALDFSYAGEALAGVQSDKGTDVEALVLSRTDLNQWLNAAPADRDKLENFVLQRFNTWLPGDHRLAKGGV